MIFHQRPATTKQPLLVMQQLSFQSSGEARCLESYCLPESDEPVKRHNSVQYEALQEPCSTTAPDAGEERDPPVGMRQQLSLSAKFRNIPVFYSAGQRPYNATAMVGKPKKQR